MGNIHCYYSFFLSYILFYFNYMYMVECANANFRVWKVLDP